MCIRNRASEIRVEVCANVLPLCPHSRVSASSRRTRRRTRSAAGHIEFQNSRGYVTCPTNLFVTAAYSTRSAVKKSQMPLPSVGPYHADLPCPLVLSRLSSLRPHLFVILVAGFTPDPRSAVFSIRPTVKAKDGNGAVTSWRGVGQTERPRANERGGRRGPARKEAGSGTSRLEVEAAWVGGSCPGRRSLCRGDVLYTTERQIASSPTRKPLARSSPSFSFSFLFFPLLSSSSP